MRQVYPDWMDAELIGVTDDDRGVVRLDGGAVLTISFEPVGASAVGVGARGKIQFRNGNKQLPKWRTCCEKNGRRTVAPVTIILSGWPVFRQNFKRTNAMPPDQTYEPGETLIYEHGPSFGRSTPSQSWEAGLQNYTYRPAVSTVTTGDSVSAGATTIVVEDSTGFSVDEAWLETSTTIEKVEIQSVSGGTIQLGRDNPIEHPAKATLSQASMTDRTWVDIAVVTEVVDEVEIQEILVLAGDVLPPPVDSQTYPQFYESFPTFEDPPERDDHRYLLQRRNLVGELIWEYLPTYREIEYPDEGGGGDPGGGPGGAS